MYHTYEADIYDEEEMTDYRPPDMSIRRYHDERYKRKVSNKIRSRYQIFCHYGRSPAKRYELWKAMKWANWRGHFPRGWHDRAFRKKLYSARARYTIGRIPNGNYYRKLTKKHNIGGQEEFSFENVITENQTTDLSNKTALCEMPLQIETGTYAGKSMPTM